MHQGCVAGANDGEEGSGGVVAGLVERRPDGDDLRAVRLCLTADGADRLARLSALHLEELRRFAPQLEALWDGLDSPL